jgi:uncharacterized protein YdeI (YjbR/CyaY-like superfamily)
LSERPTARKNADEATFFESRQAFRDWLSANHDKADVLEVGFYKKASGKPSVTYVEAVEEALCFGWIDGVRHTIDEISFANRFTPRKARSRWSDINVKRVESLIERGLMHEAGLRAFDQRDAAGARYTYEALAEPYLAQLRANEKAYAYFSAQPPGYQRLAGFWVMDAKREETRQKRLATLMEDSEAGRRIG